MRIVPYAAAHHAAFRDLNLAWIREYFSVEPRDERDLDDPDTHILRRGGAIFIAEDERRAIGERVIGTCALLRPDEEGEADYELAKMAVAEGARGQGVGRALAQAVIAHARALGAPRLVLHTNPRLAPAVHLYRQLGFEEVPLSPTPYARATLKMVLDLAPAPTHYRWGAGCDGWHLVREAGLSVIAERMPDGTAEVRHRHARARQFFFVLAGELTLECDGVSHVLRAREGLSVPPGAAHQAMNTSGAPLEFLVISAPPSHGDRIATPDPRDATAHHPVEPRPVHAGDPE